MEPESPNPVGTGFIISRMGLRRITVRPPTRRMAWLPLLLLLTQCSGAPGECPPQPLLIPIYLQEGVSSSPPCYSSQQLTFLLGMEE